ncbi:MAG TPA: hypothetical protein VJR26_09875 [Candidatus Acidoferrales bacterium]|nr:hypothetical protein [Candidatus Acidoferrales bacterium]
MARKQKKKKKKGAKAMAAKRNKSTRRKRPVRASNGSSGSRARIHQGVALERGGQSGDVQGLSSMEEADSESVSELVEEGQAFEAGIVDGVENAPDADEGAVRTGEVPEDDVSPEYRDYRERKD